MNEPEEVEYGLVMPFVVCRSKGGPYQDDAYVAGWEAGCLDQALAMRLDVLPIPNRMEFHQAFHADNRDQIDLIAMRHGMVALFSELGDGWVGLALESSEAFNAGQ